ncbi:MAG: Cation-independent mannose-6-phosphate receptor CI-MPR [Chrysothrix sp. TS-e1954]|nr:MAG: Cation-independent mannose-6-phosphate receptor CI-MPR [Chrysothrix sp. TS-e1954]
MLFLPLAITPFFLPRLTHAAASSSTTDLDFCTARAPSGSYFDLSPIHIEPPAPQKSGSPKPSKDEDEVESWHSRGYDYGANFTMNFCGPVVEELEDVVGLRSREARNVSAFYEKGGKTYSIGQQTGNFTFRGRTLSLTFENGSPCGEDALKKRSLLPHTAEDLSAPRLASLSSSSLSTSRKSDDEDDDSDDDSDDDDDSHRSDRDKHHPLKPPSSPSSSARKKQTIISFLCDRDPAPKAAKVSINFVSVTPDECVYVFNARSPAACPSVNTSGRTSLGPSGVFSVIAVIALLVYLLGGIVYQRTVMHQRGWRQLPNYSLWAGIFSFVRDFVVIVASACARCIPGLKAGGRKGGGYSRVGNGVGRGRSGSADDENRLIDQLDEEWED